MRSPQNIPRALVSLLALLICAASSAAVSVEPNDPARWQPMTLTFDGPSTSEGATPNPFRDGLAYVSHGNLDLYIDIKDNVIWEGPTVRHPLWAHQPHRL